MGRAGCGRRPGRGRGAAARGGAVEGRLRVEALAHALEFGSYTDVDFGPRGRTTGQRSTPYARRKACRL